MYLIRQEKKVGDIISIGEVHYKIKGYKCQLDLDSIYDNSLLLLQCLLEVRLY